MPENALARRCSIFRWSALANETNSYMKITIEKQQRLSYPYYSIDYLLSSVHDILATWHSALVNLYMGMMLKYRDLGEREHEQHAKYGKQRGTSIYTLLSAKPIIRSVNSKRLWIFLDKIPFRFFLSFFLIPSKHTSFFHFHNGQQSQCQQKQSDRQANKKRPETTQSRSQDLVAR